MNFLKQETQDQFKENLPGQFWRQVGGLILVAISYWIVVRLGLLLVAQPERVASIWPASGLTLAILLLNPKKKWPILLAVFFGTNILGNLSGGNPLLVSLGFGLANILEAFLAAWLLTFLFRSRIDFQTSKQMFSLFVAAAFGNGLTALLGAAVPALAFGAPFFKTWLVWWSADGLGMILIAPLIVTWATSRIRLHRQKIIQLFEGIFFLIVLTVATWFIFGPFMVAGEPVLRNYMLFPLMIWLAFRFSPRGMAINLVMVATIAVINLIHGNGILAFEHQTVTDQLVNLQLFLSVLAFSGFIMSAIVTERRRGEEQLEQNEVIFRSFLEYSPVYVFFKDKHTRSLRLSSNYESMLGVPVSEALGKTMDELFPSDLAKSMIADDLKIMEEGKRVDVIEELNGHTYETTKFPIFKDGKPVMLAGFTMDVTERMQAEQALRKAEALYKTIIEHSPVGISIRSRTGNLLSANSAWKNIWAIPEEDYQAALRR